MATSRCFSSENGSRTSAKASPSQVSRSKSESPLAGLLGPCCLFTCRLQVGLNILVSACSCSSHHSLTTRDLLGSFLRDWLGAVFFPLVTKIINCREEWTTTCKEFVLIIHNLCTMNEEELIRHVFNTMASGVDSHGEKYIDARTLKERWADDAPLGCCWCCAAAYIWLSRRPAVSHPCCSPYPLGLLRDAPLTDSRA